MKFEENYQIMDDYNNLHAEYKSLLNRAYQASQNDKKESERLYRMADKLRQQLFAV